MHRFFWYQISIGRRLSKLQTDEVVRGDGQYYPFGAKFNLVTRLKDLAP